MPQKRYTKDVCRQIAVFMTEGLDQTAVAKKMTANGFLIKESVIARLWFEKKIQATCTPEEIRKIGNYRTERQHQSRRTMSREPGMYAPSYQYRTPTQPADTSHSGTLDELTDHKCCMFPYAEGPKGHIHCGSATLATTLPPQSPVRIKFRSVIGYCKTHALEVLTPASRNRLATMLEEEHTIAA